MYRKKLTKEEALQKLRHYCAYQERSHREVKGKLYDFGLTTSDVDQAITVLIEENYLNEERYAMAFAGGHFRTKQWGKQKIAYELKQKQISAYCIQKALKSIDQDIYEETIRKVAEKKWKMIELNGGMKYEKTARLQSYLMQRGFERDIIQRITKELVNAPGSSESIDE
ncbi:MAG: regulatory protein RecX [Chitinophagaceae bacterium]